MFLYASDRKSDALQAVKALSEKGFYLFPCGLSAACFLCKHRETGGIILDCVTDPQKGEAICNELRKSDPQLPIAAILPDKNVASSLPDLILRSDTPQEESIDLLADFLRTVSRGSNSRLSTGALMLDRETKAAVYMDYPLKLTPTEHRLLYLLLYQAPRTTTDAELLLICYHGEARSSSLLHVLVHRINKKAGEIHIRPLILREGNGYRLRDGIL